MNLPECEFSLFVIYCRAHTVFILMQITVLSGIPHVHTFELNPVLLLTLKFIFSISVLSKPEAVVFGVQLYFALNVIMSLYSMTYHI